MKNKSGAQRKRNAGTSRSLSYQPLEPRQLLAGLVINEFLASNSSGLLDDNGNTSDWIELYNDSSQPINLAGYSLTDDPADTSKYVFPNLSLAGEAYLVVFAADDADPTSGSDLYTGFGLNSSGEYVGLTMTRALYCLSSLLEVPTILRKCPMCRSVWLQLLQQAHK